MHISIPCLVAILFIVYGCTATPKSENNWDTAQAIREARSAIRRNDIYLYDLGTITCPQSREIEHGRRTVVVPVKLLHCGCEIDRIDEFMAKQQYADAFNNYILKRAFR